MKRVILGLALTTTACGPDAALSVDEADVFAAPLVVARVVAYADDAANQECYEPPAGSFWQFRQPTSPGVSPFCVYEWTSIDEPPDVDPIVLHGLDPFDDNPLVMPLSSGPVAEVASVKRSPNISLSQSLRPVLANSYRNRLRVPTQLPVTHSVPNVQIALVDSTPENAPTPTSKHADTLESLINETVCNARGACAAKVKKYLALPRVTGFREDRVNGGYYGTLFDLAEAISAAVDDMTVGQELIINLSVGWEALMLPPNLPANAMNLHLVANTARTNQTHASVVAVHRALAYASCRGALIFAAAGNELLVKQPGGRMYPAGFADRPAPDPSECIAVFGAPSRTPGSRSPLLYAIGGVDHRDDLITNSIPEAIPELVAPAADVTPMAGGAVYTGTSVASAAASAVAGLVWGTASALRADQVHGVLRSSSTYIGDTATLVFGEEGDVGATRRLSACDAVMRACTLAGRTCPVFGCPEPVPAHLDGRPNKRFVTQARARLGGEHTNLRNAYRGPTSQGKCGAVRTLSASNNWSCPVEHVAAARKLGVGPQPLDPICPACIVTDDPSDLASYMSVAQSLPSGMVFNVMIDVTDEWSQSERIMVPGPIPEGFSGELQFGSISLNGKIVKATLIFDYTDGKTWFSSGEPLLVGEY